MNTNYRYYCTDIGLPQCDLCIIGLYIYTYTASKCRVSYYKEYFIPVYCNNNLNKALHLLKIYSHLNKADIPFFIKALQLTYPDRIDKLLTLI